MVCMRQVKDKCSCGGDLVSHSRVAVTALFANCVVLLVGRVVALQSSHFAVIEVLLWLQNQHVLIAEIIACRNIVIE